MRNSKDIAKELEAKRQAVEGMTDAAQIDAANEEIRTLCREMETALNLEAVARLQAQRAIISPAEQKEIKRFSISKFIREARAGQLSGFELEMNQEGLEEMRKSGQTSQNETVIPSSVLRAIDVNNVSTSTEGAEFAHVTRMSYLEGLRNALVCQKLGAVYVDGLQGNVAIVKGGSASAAWYAEAAAASVTKLAFSTVTMTPKRLQIIAGYTNDLLKQSSLAVDRIIWDELLRAHAGSLDAAAFNGSGSSGEPTGILATDGIGAVAMGTHGGAPTRAKIIDLESEVAIDNALFGSLAYVTNAKVAGKMKKTESVVGYPDWLLEDGKTNGYPVVVTNAIPSNLTKGDSSGVCSAMIFGNFNELLIGQWGGLDMIIDPFTSKGKAIIEVSALAYHDILVRRPEAFAAIKDLTTT